VRAPAKVQQSIAIGPPESTEQLESVANSKHFVVGVGAPAGST
jgi:hypothetical protein